MWILWWWQCLLVADLWLFTVLMHPCRLTWGQKRSTASAESRISWPSLHEPTLKFRVMPICSKFLCLSRASYLLAPKFVVCLLMIICWATWSGLVTDVPFLAIRACWLYIHTPWCLFFSSRKSHWKSDLDWYIWDVNGWLVCHESPWRGCIWTLLAS
jgi:hypothetical protein